MPFIRTMITNLIERRTIAFLVLALLLSVGCFGQSNPKLDFEANQLLCTVNFTPDVHHVQSVSSTPITYNWDFGDGTTSVERCPVHQYSRDGKFTTTLTVGYQNEQGNISTLSKTKSIRFHLGRKISFTETAVPIQKSIYKNVVDAEVYRYTDRFAGQAWKKAGVYSHTMTTNSILSFDWKSEKQEEGWVAKEVGSRIAPDGRMLEAVNYQGVATATLLDKNQQHVIASGVNMRYSEMAFTSFEDQSLSTGNWIFSNNPVIDRKTFSIVSAHKNFVLLDASSEETSEISTLDVWSSGVNETNSTVASNVPVLCHQDYEKNKKWSALILGSSPVDDFWSGHVQVETVLKPSVSGLVQDNDVHHSGTSSLRVTAETSVRQELLHLEPSKEYIINLWGSTASSRQRNSLPAGIGIELTFHDKKGQLLKREQIKAAGSVIEGWQQIDGAFVTPEGVATLSITFLTNGISWYDDIRLFPADGNMKSFVYESIHGKQSVILDENNRATYYFYNPDGSLYQEKKETDGGVKTVTESIAFTKSNQQ